MAMRGVQEHGATTTVRATRGMFDPLITMLQRS
jgi:hypothetical protein